MNRATPLRPKGYGQHRPADGQEGRSYRDWMYSSSDSISPSSMR